MIIPNLSEIASHVRSRRALIGITQAELAKRAGLSRATIAAIEGEKAREIGVNRISKLFKVLSDPAPSEASKDSIVRGFSNSRSKEIGLSMPYDWSNPNISDDALILNVLRRCFFDDICLITYHFGFDKVNALVSIVNDEFCVQSLRRMMRNIKNGMQG